MRQDYYVYLLIDPRTSQPFYVGKGKNQRMYYHEWAAVRNYKDGNKPHHDRIREIVNNGLKVIYEKILINVNEHLALNKERELTKKYGRLNNGTGCLLNISSGGHRGGATEKPVSQYMLDGTHVADYSSAKVASECVKGANRSYITQVCKGKRKSAGGFLWTYKNQNPTKFVKKYYRSVDQFALDGQFIRHFQSLTEAEKYTNVELHNISECCRGKSKTAGGFIWKYHEQKEIRLSQTSTD